MFLDYVIAQFYDPIMRRMEQGRLGRHRRQLIAQSNGLVLEIGSGTGANFGYYPKKVQVLALEPSAAMRKKGAAKLPTNIEWLPYGVGGAEWNQLLNQVQADTIVCTLVLCTVPNVQEALADFRKILKPGGKLLVLEHIRSANPRNARKQDFVTPVWKCVAGNCHLNRPTDYWIKEAGFEVLEEEYFALGVPWYKASFRAPGTKES